jgi:hypothetical protein
VNRIAPLVVVLALLATACGVDRESDDTLVADSVPTAGGSADSSEPADDSPDGAEEGNGSGDGADGEAEATTPTTLAPIAPPTTGVPTDIALSADLGGGNSWEITHGALNEVVVPSQENEEFVDLVFGGVVPAEFSPGVLSEHLVVEAMRVELALAGGEVSDEGREASKVSLLSQVELQLYGGQPDAADKAEALYNEAPYLPFLVEYQATQDALAEALGAQAADEGAEVPCVRHILVDTEPEADTILTRLADGEDFSELAIELSTGPSGPNGGELGCADASGYVPEFRDAVNGAEVGVPVGPVQTQFGWHVLIVDGFEPGPPPDGRALASQRLQERLSGAVVDVDENIGTWDGVSLSIVPAGF